MVFENLLTSLTVFQSSFLSSVLDTEGLGDIFVSEEALLGASISHISPWSQPFPTKNYL